MIYKIIYGGLLFCLLLGGCSSNPKLQWNQEDGYRWAELSPGWSGETGFEKTSGSRTGITFVNSLSKDNIAANQNLLNGSGVAAGDIDGDGLTDLYFAGLDGPNKLYRNLGGFEFEDITEEAGVAHEEYNSTGVVFSDIDGDEDLDLLITTMSGNNALYINDGIGNFELKRDSGLGSGKGSMTMALADIDADGDLDLYITNYKERQAKDIFDLRELALENIVRKSGDSFEVRPPYDNHFALLQDQKGYSQRELGEEDELYINTGNGTFQKVTNTRERFLDAEGNEQGLDLDWGLTAKFADLNDDFLPDLYVCNDYWTPDRVWINQGDGTFKALNKLAIRNFSFYSMAVDFSDVNRDGAVDFFVTEMLSEEHRNRMRQLVPNDPVYEQRTDDQPQYNRNSLYMNRGDATFAEISYYGGVEATGWSWATAFMDINLDGYEDLLVNTGFSYDMQDLDTQNRLSRQVMRNSDAMKGYVLQFPRLELVNKAYLNNKDLTFTDKSNSWGFSESDISHGLAAADFDNDGDLDIAMNRLNEEAAVFRNTSDAARIAVRLKGSAPNTQGIGAKIKLEGGPVPQTKEIASGGNYLSGSDPITVFAAKEDNSSHVLTVNWPGGTQSIIENVRANRIYEIQEPANGSSKSAEINSSEKASIFEDISGNIGHKHHESAFDDDRIQQLVPIELSRLGPGLSWIDYDRDGDEDLFISAARGSQPGIYENLGEGQFREAVLQDYSSEAPGDQTAIVGWAGENGINLLTGSANYEQGSTNVPSAKQFVITGENVSLKREIPGTLSTTGPLAAADYDGDGDVDLFVGGRFKPAHYPQDATSRLFINEEGSFSLDEDNAEALEDIGMVTGAVFTDYDQDGDPDLLLSRAWGSIVLLQNNEGKFIDVSQSSGLDNFKGWWNSITTGDFNNDGRPDFIATNRGTNSPYQIDSSYPLKIFYGDFDRDSRQEIVESYFEKTIQKYVPRRSLNDLAGPVPPVTRFIRSHTQFANASLEEIFRTDLENIPSKTINTLQTMVFLNKGSSFEARELPAEAQLSIAFGAVVADYNNDGNEDIFLSQNLFSLPQLFPRQDAGRGLWLKGDGTGNFEAIPGSETGIKIYGEQRGAAVSDFNRDGRIDLAVAQNNGATKLYANKTEKAGLIIQLSGPPENRNAIGSAIRVVYENGEKGPLREIQAGSGYWSQNGLVQVMGYSDFPKAVAVRWHDGTKDTVKVDTKNKIIEIPHK